MRLLAEAQGNPLALLELPAALSSPQRTAVKALPAVLPLGRRLEALFAARVAAMVDAGLAAISPPLALLQYGAAGIAAVSDSNASEFFERAVSMPDAARWPFDLARVQLTYGERLRRARATREARTHLTAALETFDRLGAAPWADRAVGELRATGLTRPRADQPPRSSITPQEHEIAMLAAAGLSNKQIAQRLFLSHKTIGNHLFRIFPKLGITSRAALRDALAQQPAGKTAEQGHPAYERRSPQDR